MNCDSARCMRASGPFMTVKREPVSLVPASKSSPSGSPTSTWSLAAKAKAAGTPPAPCAGVHLRTSTLPASPAPSGTLSCGKLGTASSSTCSSVWIWSRRVAMLSSSVLDALTWAITALASSPLALSWPICLDRLLRWFCNSSVRIWQVLRSASSAWKASTFKNACGRLRVSRRAMAEGRSLRRRLMSSMRGF